jgi:hypothetical protein
MSIPLRVSVLFSEEIDVEFSVQGGLRRSQDAIASDVAQITALKERLRAGLRTVRCVLDNECCYTFLCCSIIHDARQVTEKDTQLETWHAEMLTKADDDNADALVTPMDVPSRQ